MKTALIELWLNNMGMASTISCGWWREQAKL